MVQLHESIHYPWAHVSTSSPRKWGPKSQFHPKSMYRRLELTHTHTDTHIISYNLHNLHIYIHLKGIEKRHAQFWPLPIYTYIHNITLHYITLHYITYIHISFLYILSIYIYIYPFYISFPLKSFGFPANSQAPAHGCLHQLSAASAAVASLSARQPLGADHTPKAPSPTMTKPLWFRCYI